MGTGKADFCTGVKKPGRLLMLRGCSPMSTEVFLKVPPTNFHQEVN